jgi:hypothetical protein
MKTYRLNSFKASNWKSSSLPKRLRNEEKSNQLWIGRASKKGNQNLIRLFSTTKKQKTKNKKAKKQSHSMAKEKRRIEGARSDQKLKITT